MAVISIADLNKSVDYWTNFNSMVKDHKPFKVDDSLGWAKNEIKIREEREIFSQVEKTIRSNLINFNIDKNDISSHPMPFDFNLVEIAISFK